MRRETLVEMIERIVKEESSEFNYDVSLDDAVAALKNDKSIKYNSKLKRFNDRLGNEVVPVRFKGRIHFEKKK